MPDEFREFLYLNEKLVNELLAQAEDGIYDEDEQTLSSGTTGALRANAGVSAGPVNAGVNGERGQSGSDQRRRVVRQTPESRFNRLRAALDEGLVKIDDETPHVWPSIEARTIVEIDGYVDVPSFNRALASSGQLQGLMQMMQMFAPEQVGQQERETVGQIQAMQGLMAGSVVATVEREESDPTFVAKLDSEWLRVDVGDLEGEASVLARVKRRWPEGERYPVLAVPGLDVMSRKDRRAAEKKKKAPAAEGNSDFEIEGPGATLSVVAIYR